MDPPLTSLALESEIWLILAGICGVLLLLIGGRVIKIGLVLGGLAAGSLAGWIIWLALELPVPGWLVLGLGALVALFFALVLVRIATALLFGVILASFLAGLVLTVASFDRSSDQRPTPVPVPTMVADLVSLQLPAEASNDQPVAAALRAGVQASWNHLKTAWSNLAAEYQFALIVASLAGLVIGLLLGGIAPQFSLPIMTSLWGGLLVPACLIGLFADNEGPWQSNLAMMTGWCGLSAFGWSIQRVKRGKRPSEGD